MYEKINGHLMKEVTYWSCYICDRTFSARNAHTNFNLVPCRKRPVIKIARKKRKTVKHGRR